MEGPQHDKPTRKLDQTGLASDIRKLTRKATGLLTQMNQQLQKLRDKNQRAADEALWIRVQLATAADQLQAAAAGATVSASPRVAQPAPPPPQQQKQQQQAAETPPSCEQATETPPSCEQATPTSSSSSSATTASCSATATAEQWLLAEEVLVAAASFRAAPEAGTLLVGLADTIHAAEAKSPVAGEAASAAGRAAELLSTASDTPAQPEAEAALAGTTAGSSRGSDGTANVGETVAAVGGRGEGTPASSVVDASAAVNGVGGRQQAAPDAGSSCGGGGATPSANGLHAAADAANNLGLASRGASSSICSSSGAAPSGAVAAADSGEEDAQTALVAASGGGGPAIASSGSGFSGGQEGGCGEGSESGIVVSKAVAMMSPFVQREVVQHGYGLPGNPPVTLPKQVTSTAWAMILDYCGFHSVPGRSDKERRVFDERFIRKNSGQLCDLTSAADRLEMRGVVDLASRAIARLIEGKSAEQIREAFHLPDDLSEEEKLEPIAAPPGVAIDPRVRMLNRLYAKRRKELQQRKHLEGAANSGSVAPNSQRHPLLLQGVGEAVGAFGAAAAAAGEQQAQKQHAQQQQQQQHKDDRSLDELLDFIESSGGTGTGEKGGAKGSSDGKSKRKKAGKYAAVPGQPVQQPEPQPQQQQQGQQGQQAAARKRETARHHPAGDPALLAVPGKKGAKKVTAVVIVAGKAAAQPAPGNGAVHLVKPAAEQQQQQKEEEEESEEEEEEDGQVPPDKSQAALQEVQARLQQLLALVERRPAAEQQPAQQYGGGMAAAAVTADPDAELRQKLLLSSPLSPTAASLTTGGPLLTSLPPSCSRYMLPARAAEMGAPAGLLAAAPLPLLVDAAAGLAAAPLPADAYAARASLTYRPVTVLTSLANFRGATQVRHLPPQPNPSGKKPPLPPARPAATAAVAAPQQEKQQQEQQQQEQQLAAEQANGWLTSNEAAGIPLPGAAGTAAAPAVADPRSGAAADQASGQAEAAAAAADMAPLSSADVAAVSGLLTSFLRRLGLDRHLQVMPATSVLQPSTAPARGGAIASAAMRPAPEGSSAAIFAAASAAGLLPCGARLELRWMPADWRQ